MPEQYYENGTIPVETIIYGSFVKMAKLKSLVYNTFSNTSIAAATELNVFIDVYSVLKSLFSEHNRTDISDYTAITSGLINMCSHYRKFFKELSVHTTFYLIFSFNTCDINRKFFANYNESFKKKSEIPKFNQVAINNFELLGTLCPYLPDIHFIKSARNYESSVMIANLIESLNDGKPNLIISKDLYPLQLCALYPYTSYLYPIKRNGSDDSLMIPISEKPSFRYEFWKLVSEIRKINCNTLLDISPLNFSLFNALSRFPERDVNLLMNVASAKHVINKIVAGEDIRISIDQLYSDADISSKIPVAVVESRFKALDTLFMLPYYKADPESKSIKLVNLSDPATVNMINSKFFSTNPLNLFNL